MLERVNLKDREGSNRKEGNTSSMTSTVVLSQGSPWALTLVTFLLFLLSTAQSLPLDLADSPVGLLEGREGAFGPSSGSASSAPGEEDFFPQQQDLQSNNKNNENNNVYQQLVHQGQLYLPTLFHQQDNSLHGSLGSDYPVASQSQDDSVGTDWETVIDPHLYILNEWSPSRGRVQQRKRRNAGPSLSIVNPLDVLRQRLLLEIARRRMIKSQNQILANAEILKNIGRRR